MREKTIKLYNYAELSSEAQARARDWYREGIAHDDNYVEGVYEIAADAAKLFGFDIYQRRVKLMNGDHRYAPAIFYSGFWSQGDGACCEGSWRAIDVQVGATAKEFPQDEELKRIASFFEFIAPLYPTARFSVKHRGRYYHSSCTEFDIELFDGDEQAHEAITIDRIKSEARAFMDWIYARLGADWDFQNSDEVVAENIIANGYEFTADGKIA